MNSEQLAVSREQLTDNKYLRSFVMKKKAVVFLGILTVLAFVLTSCPSPEGGGTDFIPGATLSIRNQQVYVQDFDLEGFDFENLDFGDFDFENFDFENFDFENFDPENFNFEDFDLEAFLLENFDKFGAFSDLFNEEIFTGNLSISDGGLGGTGSIVKGKLNYTIGVPDVLEPLTIDDVDAGGAYTDIRIIPNDVNGAACVLTVDGSADYESLLKSKLSTGFNAKGGSFDISSSGTVYLYVDKNAVISAKGATVTESGMNINTKDFTLKLKEGWNTIGAEVLLKLSVSSIDVDLGISGKAPPGIKWILR